MRILFVSILRDPGASGAQRLWAIRQLGHEVTELPLDGFDRRGPMEARLRERVLRALPFRRSDENALGDELVRAIDTHRPELVWIEKALLLRPGFLQAAKVRAPRTRFVCFQDDDPFGFRTRERPGWSNFLQAIPCYDAHLVKREANRDEFARAGARRTLMFMHGVYPPLFHAPADAGQERHHQILFAGTPHDHRVGIVDALVSRYQLPLTVLGPGWQRSRCWRSHRGNFGPAVFDASYADALRTAKIALGFVSSSNRDEYSMRTFEIPACGALLLAERTPAHQALFREGEQAEFFASAEECADKCRYYLEHEAARVRVAAAGHAAVSRPEHALTARLHAALAELMEPV